MIKVAIFKQFMNITYNDDEFDISKRINEFLELNDDIEIIDIKQTEAALNSHCNYLVISIFYKLK